MDRPDVDPWIAQSMIALRTLLRALQGAASQAQAQLGMSRTQIAAMQRLATRPALSIAELSDRAGTSLAAMAAQARRLESRGLITRVDRSLELRRVKLAITDEGRALLAASQDGAPAVLIASLQRMSEADRTRLARLLEEWVHLAGLSSAKPAGGSHP